ncbi:hypothetical protein [Streptomyces sp. NPDC051554]|uniref:hypothetical protein n=1 Tax=Streptomyces sp. NPDC051554 TaxID=3365656 RepID=UPI00379114ED
MTRTPFTTVPLTDSTMLSFDGSVLEVFGEIDAGRYHIWEEPRLEFRPGRSRTLVIRTRPNRRRQSVFYDPSRRAGLQALAEQLGRSEPGGSAS